MAQSRRNVKHQQQSHFKGVTQTHLARVIPSADSQALARIGRIRLFAGGAQECVFFKAPRGF